MKNLIPSLMLVMALALAGTAPAQGLPAIEDGKVIMKWADFEKILKELLKPPPGDDPEPEPPVEHSMRQADFELTIEEGHAALVGRYAVEVLVDKKWVMVPVGRAESGVHRALLDDQPALLMTQRGYLYVLIKGKAAHQLVVHYTAPAPQNPGPNSVRLPAAPVPGALISLTAPEKLTDIRINNAVITRQDKLDGRARLEAVLSAGEEIAVFYTVPAPELELTPEEQAEIKPRLYSSAELLLTIADEVTTVSARFNYDIKRAPVSRISLQVPADCEVVNVSGQGVTTWKVEDGVLKVILNYEVQGSYALEILIESKREQASGEVEIPELRSLEVERESGFVAIVTSESLEVELAGLEGLRPMDPLELPPGLKHRSHYPVLYALSFASHPATGSLKVTRHQEMPVLTATIDIINLVALFTEDGKSVTRVIYEIRNNKQQYLKLELPEEAQVWSAFLDDRPVKPARNEKGQTLIPLKKSGADGEKVSFTAELIYYAPIPEMNKKGALKTVFPQADIPASEMLVTLYLPPNFDYHDFEGDLEELKDERPLAEAPDEALVEDWEAPPVSREKSVRYSKRAYERQVQMEQEIADEIQAIKAPPPAPPAKTGPTTTPAVMPSERALGMLAVKFNVPLRGSVHRLTKLLVMDEAPTIQFKYKKHREPLPWDRIGLGIKIAAALLVMLLVIWIIWRVKRAAGRDSIPMPGG